MSTFKEIYMYREMITSLVRKDLKGRYKGSALGFLWTFMNPLLQLVVYNLVFSTILRSGIEKYYLFLFVALIPWLFFSTCLSAGSACIIGEKSLITKIYFPREIIPIAYVTGAFINMLYSFVVVLFVVVLFADNVNILAWAYLPVIMLVEYIMVLGMTFLACSVTVYFRDLQYILGIIAMAWQFLTPVMYSFEMVPENLWPIFAINPMTSVILAYRDILYYGKAPDLYTLTHALIFGIILFVVGLLTFSKLKRHFAEEL